MTNRVNQTLGEPEADPHCNGHNKRRYNEIADQKALFRTENRLAHTLVLFDDPAGVSSAANDLRINGAYAKKIDAEKTRHFRNRLNLARIFDDPNDNLIFR